MTAAELLGSLVVIVLAGIGVTWLTMQAFDIILRWQDRRDAELHRGHTFDREDA